MSDNQDDDRARLVARRERDGVGDVAGFMWPFIIKTHWPKPMVVTVVDSEGERTVEVDCGQGGNGR